MSKASAEQELSYLCSKKREKCTNRETENSIVCEDYNKKACAFNATCVTEWCSTGPKCSEKVRARGKLTKEKNYRSLRRNDAGNSSF